MLGLELHFILIYLIEIMIFVQQFNVRDETQLERLDNLARSYRGSHASTKKCNYL